MFGYTEEQIAAFGLSFGVGAFKERIDHGRGFRRARHDEQVPRIFDDMKPRIRQRPR